MGGKGSGRPPKEKALIHSLQRRPEPKAPIASDMFLPNHSGIASNKEANDTFVKKSGDTMTGELTVPGVFSTARIAVQDNNDGSNPYFGIRDVDDNKFSFIIYKNDVDDEVYFNTNYPLNFVTVGNLKLATTVPQGFFDTLGISSARWMTVYTTNLNIDGDLTDGTESIAVDEIMRNDGDTMTGDLTVQYADIDARKANFGALVLEEKEVTGVEELGGDGDFSSSDSWTLDSGWSISGGVLSGSWAPALGGYDAEYDDFTPTAGKIYAVQYTINSISGMNDANPTLQAYIGGSRGDYITSTGTFTEYITASNTDKFMFESEGMHTSGSVEIDDVTIYEVTDGKFETNSITLNGSGQNIVLTNNEVGQWGTTTNHPNSIVSNKFRSYGSDPEFAMSAPGQSGFVLDLVDSWIRWRQSQDFLMYTSGSSKDYMFDTGGGTFMVGNRATETGQEYFEIVGGGNAWLRSDNDKILLGAGKDASIYYDGTDLIIDPKEVGSGVVNLNGGDLTTTGTGTFGDVEAASGDFSNNLKTSGRSHAIVSKTSAYTATAQDEIIICNASSSPFTITLPKISDVPTGLCYNIKKIDSSTNAITINPDGTETIDDSLNFSLSGQYDAVTIISDGSEWWVI